MIFLTIIYWVILIVGLPYGYEENYAGHIISILSIIIVLLYIAHIVTLALAVKKRGERKDMASSWIWAILTFIFGLPAAILFAFFTGGIKDYEKKKRKNNSAVITLISFTLLAVSIIGAIASGLYSEYYVSTHFPSEYIYYVDAEGKQVIYDKTGNAYTREEEENFKYYSRDGKTYSSILHYDLFDSEPTTDGYSCIEDCKEYYTYEYDFAIDRDGYLVMFPENELEYELGVLYDKNGNIYYYEGNCYWTPDGELIIADELEKITYQDILDYEEEYVDEEY